MDIFEVAQKITRTGMVVMVSELEIRKGKGLRSFVQLQNMTVENTVFKEGQNNLILFESQR